MWQLLAELRGERRTGRSARMLFEVLGDIWVVERNPYLQDDLLDNPKRQRMLVDALRHRLNEIDKRRALRQRRRRGDERERDAKVAKLVNAARAAVDRFAAWFADGGEAAQAHGQRAFASHRPRQHRVRRHVARLARHRRDRLARRVPVRRPVPGHRAGSARHSSKAASSSGSRSFRAAAAPATRAAPSRSAPRSAVINTEKLERLSAIEPIAVAGRDAPVPTVDCGAGVVTKRAMDVADAAGLVFACDPTSADASCIGGNVAMNAGGKKAVLWGTAVDNLLSWRMVTPDAQWLEVTRLDHNLGKIHDAPVATFELDWLGDDGRTSVRKETLRIEGTTFRKVGLGKDVTDKFLAGLPGVQKEGCDGIITSARFVLHRMPPAIRTVCLEFFGTSHESTPSIVEIKRHLDAQSARRRSSPASSISTSATSRRSATRRRRSVTGARAWC